MTKINIIGNIFGVSGYAVHTREFFNALAKINPEVKLDTPLAENWLAVANDKELEAIKQPWYKDGVTYMIGMPHQWQHVINMPQKKFIGCCVWEGDRIPLGFSKALNKADIITVPSKHTFEAVVKTCPDIQEKVFIIPHGVDIDHFKPQKNDSENFVFLANKGWASGINDRGGIQYLIKAFCEEFKPDEKVELRIKINPAYNVPGWDLQNELNKLNLPERKPKIYFNTAPIEYKYLPEFYKGDCFVSPTMAEGFSIPCAEALASEIPVITTCYGGQTDFVNNENGWLLQYKLCENDWDYLYEGIKWAVPDLEDLKYRMRHAFNNKDECIKKGKEGRKWVKENLTWELSAKKFLNILES